MLVCSIDKEDVGKAKQKIITADRAVQTIRTEDKVNLSLSMANIF